MSHVFLVVGPNCWAKAPTIKNAIRQCKGYASRGLRSGEEWDVFQVDPLSVVTQMGALRTSGPPERISGRGQFMLLDGETDPNG